MNFFIKTGAKIIMFCLLFIPVLLGVGLLVKAFPLSFAWLIIYIGCMLFIIKLKTSYQTKGALIIYIGAAIAVLGKAYMIEAPDYLFHNNKNLLVLDTFFQVMLMTSSGVGGGLLVHYIINKDKIKK